MAYTDPAVTDRVFQSCFFTYHHRADMIFHGVEITHHPGYLYAVHFPEQEL